MSALVSACPRAPALSLPRYYDNTPASKGGLQSGDIITSIAGKTIKDAKMVQSITAGLPVNKAVAVEVVRESKKVQLNLTIEGQPGTYGLESGVPARARRASPAAQCLWISWASR